MKLSPSFHNKILAAFTIAILVVAGLAALAWKMAADAADLADRVAHTQRVLDGLARIRGDSLQIELNTQSFRLTGDPARLRERDVAVAEREKRLLEIREMTADNPVQQERWTSLRAVIDERLAISRRVEMLRKTQGVEAANAYIADAPLQETRERVYRLLNEMEAEEQALLASRSAGQSRVRRVMVAAGVSAAVGLLLALSAFYLLILRQIRTAETVRQESRRAEREYSERLERQVQERTRQLAQSEDHLRQVINNVPAMIAYVDAQERYVYVNAQYLERFAPGQADIAGRTVRDILGEERYAIASPRIARALLGDMQSYDWEPFPGVWHQISYLPKQEADGRMVGYYVMGCDITERKRSEIQIQTLNAELERHVRELEFVSRALRTLSAGNRTMLRETDEQSLLKNMCRAIVQSGGYQMAAVWYRVDDARQSLRPMAECGHEGGLAALRAMSVSWGDNEYGQAAAATAIRSGGPRVVHDISADPAYAPWRASLAAYASVVACPLHVGGTPIGALVIYARETDSFGTDEVTLLTESADDLAFGIGNLRAHAEQQRTQESMHRLTHFDSLTGLPNQAQLSEALTAAADGENRRFAVLQLNIERLSEINDALGFSQGDQVLREVGRRLQEAAPAGALVARLRGDEFALMLPAAGQGEALALVQRLENALQVPFPVADILLDVSARVGVALYPEHGPTLNDLLRHMDIAMREAKRKGAGHAVFDPSSNRRQEHRLGTAGELRRAIEGGQLRLYLQPKVDIATGRLCGSEGLVRWQHPIRGLVPPGEFIPLAEHTGLIRPLTEWLIETSLRLNRGWLPSGRVLPIAINLSARNLHDESLCEKMIEMQQAAGLPAGLLELEITESTAMADPEHALQILHRLRDLGIPLAIDDFGTGYSSLSYLQKLPVSCIKIDQSFVRAMGASKDALLIVRSTVDLVHDLDRKVVAEGVETQAQWDQLARLGCDIAQGYFIARPMPAEVFPDWVAAYGPPVTA